jgi:predicted aldo/keto reductase-like oxidoreductase
MALLIQSGINHVDTAASYGRSEELLGQWIRRNGAPFFLASKTEKRTKPEAYEQICMSLDRLHVTHLDMIQIHALHEDADWNRAFGPGGVLEAVIQARGEGLVRYIGVTAHGVLAPEYHLRSLTQFDFDAVLLPYNFSMMQNPAYSSSFEKLAFECRDRNIALQTIKGLSRSPWNEKQPNRTTWYRPIEDPKEISLTVDWILGNLQVFLNTAGDITILPHILKAAQSLHHRPSDQTMHAQAERLKIEPLFT